MKLRPPVIAASVMVVAALLLAMQFARPRREPEYEGRVLSDWLNHHVPSSAAVPTYNSPGWHKAQEALLAIGTNGIPVLLEMLQTRDLPPSVWELARFANRFGLRIRLRRAGERIEEAEYAFNVLNTNAAIAVPELIRIYERNISPTSRNCAAMALGHMGKHARTALPVLIRNFTHTNEEVRFNAVSAVMDIGGDPDVVLPALTTALKDPTVGVRWNALVGLSNFGRRASNSVPEILKMNTQMAGNGSMTQQIATALWRIAPEKTGLPFIVEQPTKIAGTVTTQALKMELFGERKTLIPPGRPLPAMAQYWNSDPRPSLKLYRGDPDSDANDHFLGEFEVLDIADANNVNISTLVIVSDGQIILNARDNTRERFLPVRRTQNPVFSVEMPDTPIPHEPGSPNL